MRLSEKYAYEVYEKKSFSLAAKALFISQPALSATVARLEQELGFRLFERSKGSTVKVTPRGQIYMDMLEEMRFCEETMLKKLEQYDRAPSERLRIGTMMYTAYSLIPEVLRRFHQQFPDVSVDLNLGTVGPHGVLHDKLESGGLDLLLSYRPEDRFESFPLLSERFWVVMRRDLPCAKMLEPYSITRENVLRGNFSDEQKLPSLSLLDPVPFIGDNCFSYSHWQSSKRLGSHYSFSKFSVSDSRHKEVHYHLMLAGLGAVVATDLHIGNPLFDRDDLIFLLPEMQSDHTTLYLLHRKGERLGQTAQQFINVLVECCREISQAPHEWSPHPSSAVKKN